MLLYKKIVAHDFRVRPFCFDEANNVCRKECSVTPHTQVYPCTFTSIMNKETLPSALLGLFTDHDDADSRFLRNVGTYKQAKLC